ncbi:MAG: lipopolysaccharide transport system permease protein [Bacteriovoracaceae bacterium]|jgi:lipopolysaccharide transport system permease protein
MRKKIENLKEFIHNYRDIFLVLTQKEIKLRYKSKYLGYLWSVLNPLLYCLLYYFIFSVVMKVKIENYPAFLVCGLFPWQWVGNSIGVSPMIFVGNASLIKKLNFPRNILPQVNVAQDAFHFVLTIPVIVVTLLLHDIYPSWSYLYGIPLLVILQFIFLYCFALLVATINLFFRDTENLIKFFLMFSMYMTPVMYSAEMIPEKFRHLIVLNPFAPLIISWRNLLMDGVIIWEYMGFLVLYCVLFWVLAHYIYNKLSSKFAEVI